MWTCDIIKAMQIIEEQEGYPICVKRITPSMGGVIIIETTDEICNYYDTTLGEFID